MATKNDPFAVALRNLRRGLGNGKTPAGKDATGEWLAVRWEPYLKKRATKATPSVMCAEIVSILGEGTPPAWFRREVTEEERSITSSASDVEGGSEKRTRETRHETSGTPSGGVSRIDREHTRQNVHSTGMNEETCSARASR